MDWAFDDIIMMHLQVLYHVKCQDWQAAYGTQAAVICFTCFSTSSLSRSPLTDTPNVQQGSSTEGEGTQLVYADPLHLLQRLEVPRQSCTALGVASKPINDAIESANFRLI